MGTSYPLKARLWENMFCNVKDVVLELPVEFWNIDTQFDRAGKLSTTL